MLAKVKSYKGLYDGRSGENREKERDKKTSVSPITYAHGHDLEWRVM